MPPPRRAPTGSRISGLDTQRSPLPARQVVTRAGPNMTPWTEEVVIATPAVRALAVLEGLALASAPSEVVAPLVAAVREVVEGRKPF